MVCSRLVSCLVVAVVCLAPGSASAVEGGGKVPHGPMSGEVPPPGEGHSAKLLESGGSLVYHGGPVVHRSTTYAIFWTGPSRIIPPPFEDGIARFLEAVAAESGGHDNVYSTTVEYGDSSAVAAYEAKFGGALQDTAPLSTGGCASTVIPAACISAEQLREQLDGFIAAQQLPRGLHTVYLLFLPPGFDTCNKSACAYTDFCGYHSWLGEGGDTTLYAVLPWQAYLTGSLAYCRGPQSPNGFPALDTAVSVVSHEQIEILTDPLVSAWSDSEGNEIADKCAWEFGTPLGGSPSNEYNQRIGTNDYALQLEWSNAASGCVAGSDLVPPAPPANDLFALAQPLTGRVAERSGDTTFEASKEVGEPNHAGNEGGGSIWYRWTPPRLGTATIDTAGSNFDTLLGVYTGPTVSQLTEVAADDDSVHGEQSQVRFVARPGTTYRIAVDGFNERGEPTGGSAHLHLSEEPAPNTRIIGSHRIAGARRRARVRFGLLSKPRTGHFECRLDGHRFQRCRRHPIFRVGGGRHLLQARAVAPSGLADPHPARFSFRVEERRTGG